MSNPIWSYGLSSDLKVSLVFLLILILNYFRADLVLRKSLILLGLNRVFVASHDYWRSMRILLLYCLDNILAQPCQLWCLIVRAHRLQIGIHLHNDICRWFRGAILRYDSPHLCGCAELKLVFKGMVLVIDHEDSLAPRARCHALFWLLRSACQSLGCVSCPFKIPLLGSLLFCREDMFLRMIRIDSVELRLGLPWEAIVCDSGRSLHLEIFNLGLA